MQTSLLVCSSSIMTSTTLSRPLHTLTASSPSHGICTLSRPLLALPQPLLACNVIAFTTQSRRLLPFSWSLHALSKPLQQSANIGTQSLSKDSYCLYKQQNLLAYIRPLLVPYYSSYTLTRLFQYNTPTFTASVNTPIRLLKLSHGLY